MHTAQSAQDQKKFEVEQINISFFFFLSVSYLLQNLTLFSNLMYCHLPLYDFKCQECKSMTPKSIQHYFKTKGWLYQCQLIFNGPLSPYLTIVSQNCFAPLTIGQLN